MRGEIEGLLGVVGRLGGDVEMVESLCSTFEILRSDGYLDDALGALSTIWAVVCLSAGRTRGVKSRLRRMAKAAGLGAQEFFPEPSELDFI